MKIHGCLFQFIFSVSINEVLVAIPEKYEKQVKLLRKANANEYSLNKEQTSYNDLLDAQRLRLKGFNIN
jgi:hypothetical protein